MIKIDFLAESDIFDLSKAVSEYQSIWQKEGKKIVGSIEKISGQKFADTAIEAESKDPVYKKAWQWALSFDKKERAQKFLKVSAI